MSSGSEEHIDSELLNTTTPGKKKKKCLKTDLSHSKKSKLDEEQNEGNKEVNNSISEGKFYFIDDRFKKQLKTQKRDFSLLQKFDNSSQDNNENQLKNHKFISNHEIQRDQYKEFRSDTYSNKSGKIDQPEDAKWWKKETLFFKPDDERFKEAVAFLSNKNEEFANSFSKLRKDIKEHVRYKINKVKTKNLGDGRQRKFFRKMGKGGKRRRT